PRPPLFPYTTLFRSEGNGPMSPDAKPCGVVLAGTHPAAVDCAAATLMGFNWRKIPLLKNAFQMRELNFTAFPIEQVKLLSNQSEDRKSTRLNSSHLG